MATAPRSSIPGRLVEAAPTVDAVVDTLPGTAATEHLLDRGFFDALRPIATLVNVGRGTAVDEPALVDASTSPFGGRTPAKTAAIT